MKTNAVSLEAVTRAARLTATGYALAATVLFAVMVLTGIPALGVGVAAAVALLLAS